VPILEQHFLEPQAVDDGIVAAIVVHGQIHALGPAVEGAGGPRDLLELALAVEVIVLLGDRRALALDLRQEPREVPAV
jgi:hypothetical protein